MWQESQDIGCRKPYGLQAGLKRDTCVIPISHSSRGAKTVPGWHQDLQKRLASYKHFRTLDNRRAPTQLANISSVQEMLTTHKAVLLVTKAGSAAIKKVTKKR